MAVALALSMIGPAEADSPAYPLTAYGLDTTASLRTNIEALTRRQKAPRDGGYDAAWQGGLNQLPKSSAFIGVRNGRISRIVVSLNFTADIAVIERHFGLSPVLRHQAKCSVDMLTDHQPCSLFLYGCTSAATGCSMEVTTYTDPELPSEWGGHSGFTLITWSATSRLPDGFP